MKRLQIRKKDKSICLISIIRVLSAFAATVAVIFVSITLLIVAIPVVAGATAITVTTLAILPVTIARRTTAQTARATLRLTILTAVCVFAVITWQAKGQTKPRVVGQTGADATMAVVATTVKRRDTFDKERRFFPPLFVFSGKR